MSLTHNCRTLLILKSVARFGAQKPFENDETIRNTIGDF